MRKSREIVAFGDFQTPPALAAEVVAIARRAVGNIATVIEPTCGTGAFLRAFSQGKTTADNLVGWEINPTHVALARRGLAGNGGTKATILEKDFFQIDWEKLKAQYRTPVLFAGNPPWVTNARLGRLHSQNLPDKSNFQGHAGLAAITGRGNFDISEWMLIKIAEHIAGTPSAMAFLVKTAVARKIFRHIARNHLAIDGMAIRRIDAKKHFNVHVDACLFCARGAKQADKEYRCEVYSDLAGDQPYQTLGFSKGHLVADINTYERLADLDSGCELRWRSGIKHDASRIMELRTTDRGLVNGLGERVRLPANYLYPMYKGSHISRRHRPAPDRFMLVTQSKAGAETASIAECSPATWRYLLKHAATLDARQSRIYKKAPRFAVFGVGAYTFKPWKIAIAGMYKNLHFSKIGPFRGRSVVLDDTCYLLGLDREDQADFVLKMLRSDVAQRFIGTLVFKDGKRPVTAALLNRISLRALSLRLNRGQDFDRLFPAFRLPKSTP